MEKIMAELQKLGFSQYECKAYVSLLQHSPVTGYELSKRCGVPRSMIYEVLNKLIDRGAVYTVPSDPAKYSPVPAKEYLKRIRGNMDETFDFLDINLCSLEKISQIDVITHVSGDEAVISELKSIIDNASSELWISIWEPQIEVLRDNIKKAQERGVKIYSILFGAKDTNIGITFHHEYMTPDVIKNRTGGSLTVASMDGQEIIVACFSENSVPWAVKTRDRALVMIASEYMRQDIMIEIITRILGSDKIDELWRNNSDLMHIVTGKQHV